LRGDHVFGVERVIIHETYRAAIDGALKIAFPKARQRSLGSIPLSVGNDIALLRLDRQWTGAISELSLAAASDPPTPPGAQVRVAGFGKTENNMDKDKLDRFERADIMNRIVAEHPGREIHVILDNLNTISPRTIAG
jgi:hypothetical protein